MPGAVGLNVSRQSRDAVVAPGWIRGQGLMAHRRQSGRHPAPIKVPQGLRRQCQFLPRIRLMQGRPQGQDGI
jgi:hypothetical protein